MSEKSIAELRAELRAAEQAEHARKNALRAKVREIYRYTLEPVQDRIDRVLDESCCLYHFRGEVTNQDELAAVGKQPFGLGSRYVFCWDIEKFVCSTGGGSFNHAMQSVECWAELSSFIAKSPEGGDVTEICRKYEKSE